MHGYYRLLIVTHTLAAVLGLGMVTAVAVTGRAVGKSRHATDEALAWLTPLLRYSAVSLGAMMLTGVMLDLAASGVWRGSWWFRGSVLLLIAIGALHGRARAMVRNYLSSARQQSNTLNGEETLRRVSKMALVMCGLIVAITVLMEVKPF
jgi:hypothetical protein